MKNNARAYLAFTGTFVPNWLLVRGEISHGAKLTYARLAQKIDARGRVRLHLAKLAAHLGSEVQKVIVFLIELEKQSLIEIQNPLAGASSLCCLLPNHPWIDHLEMGKTNGSHDSGVLKMQSKSNGHTRASGSNQQRDELKREGATSGNGKTDSHPIRQPLSNFTYEACLQHAIRKKEAGEPIRNVNGLANHFYWTGKEDGEIAKRFSSGEAIDGLYKPSDDL